ncbi:MAG TPA: hypothetical protein VLF19_04460 [Methylomirabilota bacterium]|nr:hypothetical protein [Methylomirabilota bacterium]
MWNTALWIDVATWAAVLALPVWLLIEEIVHRAPRFRAVTPRARAPRPAVVRPAPASQGRVDVESTAHA